MSKHEPDARASRVDARCQCDRRETGTLNRSRDARRASSSDRIANDKLYRDRLSDCGIIAAWLEHAATAGHCHQD